jgi:hypothetical protein
MEDQVSARAAQQGEIAFKVPGVMREIFPGAELGRVYVDRDDDIVGAAACDGDQGKMSVMEISHGRDESDDTSFVSLHLNVCAYCGNRAHGFHGAHYYSNFMPFCKEKIALTSTGNLVYFISGL